jgi:hypothetical protein
MSPYLTRIRERSPSCTKASNTAVRSSVVNLLQLPGLRPPVLRLLAKGHLSKFVYFRLCLQPGGRIPAARRNATASRPRPGPPSQHRPR